MRDSDRTGNGGQTGFLTRRVSKVVDAHFATVGMALTFVLVAIAGAIIIRFADRRDFSSLGLAVWWALQTVTTVGYGDVVPTTPVGRVVGGIEMVLGVSFIALLTATVTSAVIQRSGSEADEDHGSDRERDRETVLMEVAAIGSAVNDLKRRVDHIEQNLAG